MSEGSIPRQDSTQLEFGKKKINIRMVLALYNGLESRLIDHYLINEKILIRESVMTWLKDSYKYNDQSKSSHIFGKINNLMVQLSVEFCSYL